MRFSQAKKWSNVNDLHKVRDEPEETLGQVLKGSDQEHALSHVNYLAIANVKFVVTPKKVRALMCPVIVEGTNVIPMQLSSGVWSVQTCFPSAHVYIS